MINSLVSDWLVETVLCVSIEW